MSFLKLVIRVEKMAMIVDLKLKEKCPGSFSCEVYNLKRTEEFMWASKNCHDQDGGGGEGKTTLCSTVYYSKLGKLGGIYL